MYGTLEDYELEEDRYWEEVDRAYDQFKDDMCTESYESNCEYYGKSFVDMFLNKRRDRVTGTEIS
jgi:hypothetical protein